MILKVTICTLFISQRNEKSCRLLNRSNLGKFKANDLYLLSTTLRKHQTIDKRSRVACSGIWHRGTVATDQRQCTTLRERPPLWIHRSQILPFPSSALARFVVFATVRFLSAGNTICYFYLSHQMFLCNGTK